MGGSKTTVFGGLICGAVAAAWLFSHKPGDNGGSAVSSRAGSNASSHHASGWRWLPWSGGGDSSDDAAIAKAVKDLAKLGPYEGKRIPVLVRVIDDEGRPIPGVQIETRVDHYQYADAIRLARPEPTPGPNGEIAEEDSYEEDGTEYEGTSAVDDYVPLETNHAGRDGSFLAKVIPSVGTTFVAKDRDGREGRSEMVLLLDEAGEEGEAPSYYSETSHAYPTDGKPFLVTIEMQEPGTLAGVVVDDRGHPIEGATVSVTARANDEDYSESPVTQPVTDANGVFKIPVPKAGAFDLEIHATHFQTLTEAAVQVLPGHETALNLTLMPGFLIKGTVVGPRGEPVEGVTVEAYGAETSSSTSVLADGSFAIDELPSGKYTVQVAATGFLPISMEAIDAGGAPMQLRLQEGGHINGDVFVSGEIMGSLAGPEWREGSDEDAVLGGTIYVEALDRPGVEGPVNQAVMGLTVDRRGHGTFDVQALPAGRYRVSLSLGSNWAFGDPVTVSLGNASTVSLRMPDANGAHISGLVRRADGTLVADGSVYLQGGIASTMAAQIDANGHYEFPSVPPGSFTLRANFYETESRQISNTVHETTVRMISSYSDPIELEVRAHERITRDIVMVPPTPPIQQSEDLVLSQVEAPQVIDETEGETVTGEDEEKPRFLPDVRLEPDDNGLLVTHAPPGPKNARLYPGDRVTSIDGKRVEDAYESLDWLSGDEGTTCRITVDRPASRESITVSLPRTISSDTGEGRQIYRERFID